MVKVNKVIEKAKSTSRGIRLESGTPLAGALQYVFFLVPALLYYLTACRTPEWVDATLVLSNATRPALSSWVDTHSLFNLLGYLWLKLFSRQDVYFHLVLLAGIFGALSVYFIYRTVLELTSEVISAGIAALVLMVSHSLWWHSTTLTINTLISAITALMLFFIARYERTKKPIFLYMAAFFWGLGCCNHVLMGLFILAFVVLLIASIVRRQPHVGRYLAIAVLCFLAGLAFYLFLFIRDVRENLLLQVNLGQQSFLARVWQAFQTTFDAATGGKFKALMFTRDMPAELKSFWRFTFFFWCVYNFPSPALVMGLYGLWEFSRKRAFRFTFFFFSTAILALAVWSANYFVWDMYKFALPVFVLFSIPVGLAAERLLRAPRVIRVIFLALLMPMLLLPGFIYSWMPAWYHAGGFFQRYFNSYPQISWTSHTWDPVEYIVNTNKRGYDKVERYAKALFAVLPQGAHFLNSDSRSDYPLRFYYRDLHGIRTDVEYHSLFSPFLTASEGLSAACELKELLGRGEPVYSASILYPEKVVLDQLYLLNDPSRSLESLQRLTADAYVRSFPRVDIQQIVLFPEEQIWIYRLSPK